MIRRISPQSFRPRALLCMLAIVLGLTSPAAAQTPDELAARAAESFDSGRFTEALRDLDLAREHLEPNQRALAASIDFNRSCALLKLDKPTEAEALLRELDTRPGLDRPLRARVRYNLGLLEAAHAESLARSEPPKAIQTLRSAERRFRNALADAPADTDAARNIDIVQRRRAELMKQQEQQQKQDQQQNKQDKQDQQQNKKDQQKQDQQSERDQQQEQREQQQQQDRQQNSQEQKQQQQQDQQHGADQQQHQPDSKPGENPQQQQQQQKQPDKPSPQDPKQQPQPKDQEGDPKEQKDAKQPRPSDAVPNATEQREPQSQREFDVAAAQILDKERLRREQIRRMLQQMMRTRAVKTDKDW